MGQDHSSSSKLVIIGSIGAPFGINGWLKVNSYTEPKENLLHFKKWFLVDENNTTNSQQPLPCVVLEARETKDRFLVLFTGVADRSKAATLTNKKIAIKRDDLPELSNNEYYWADLIVSKVYNLSEKLLGVLDHMFVTAANDVMVVKETGSIGDKEYLIPYNLGEFVIKVDLPNKTIIVNWDLD